MIKSVEGVKFVLVTKSIYFHQFTSTNFVIMLLGLWIMGYRGSVGVEDVTQTALSLDQLQGRFQISRFLVAG